MVQGNDDSIDKERYVAVKVKGAGVVVFSSCSHAGIVNVCRHARDLSGVPLLAAAWLFKTDLASSFEI